MYARHNEIWRLMYHNSKKNVLYYQNQRNSSAGSYIVTQYGDRYSSEILWDNKTITGCSEKQDNVYDWGVSFHLHQTLRLPPSQSAVCSRESQNASACFLNVLAQATHTNQKYSTLHYNSAQSQLPDCTTCQQRQLSRETGRQQLPATSRGLSHLKSAINLQQNWHFCSGFIADFATDCKCERTLRLEET